MSYVIERVSPADRRLNARVDALLQRGGIQRDRNLDYTCAMLDEDYDVVATGSCFGSTLRCFAVSPDHQGEGLLNQVVSHLVQVQMERGNTHLFLYTKCDSARFFGDLGFYEIARVDGRVVFMENRRDGFESYLRGLAALAPAPAPGARVGALVMNANPFTLGHRYLAQTASARCDRLYLFVVSEDASLFPFEVRWRLVREGTAQLDNVTLCRTGPYMISTATFPSYFLKEDALVSESHARLDVAVFRRIAGALGIGARFVGEERASAVTSLYNRVMAEDLARAGLACHVVPRIEKDGQPISASTVRRLLRDGQTAQVRPLVPESTWRYLTSPEAAPVIAKIRAAQDVVHH